MTDLNHIASSFTVTSGALCFGTLSNMLGGAHALIQYPPTSSPRPTGTVVAHQFEHNVPAKNGDWNVYKLRDIDSPRVDGWFAAHQDVDPVPELTKILRVAGSPYEETENTFNNDATRAEKVFLVNRYDWGYYVGGSEVEEAEDEEDELAASNTIGLVDHAHGIALVQKWARQKSRKRRPSENGVWMYIPDAEYMWGRFGFNDDYTEARSFLYFTQRTEFRVWMVVQRELVLNSGESGHCIGRGLHLDSGPLSGEGIWGSHGAFPMRLQV
ncbi:uncharacterized protein NECHADRAFT_86843 [Fusarium vanettenii 77-13-4]|uniref:Uncharacterized protein n=1 Tax=Fusarium vanettenii (strain ATCC MYA-4622 / CBS 123669 / FGSC 9596 / NRRL 45880 / 77-13-4) TaxID=660122 RepID=C7ZK83_FUSV7|nr:uncharacterized protein NECHADRAFT_86843 [Fusarium vanettenii 77-13-4]EEU35633.1 hypothetical protein NECHADRAFT_86843 [Fusarium vanettenii 77-13-4]